MPDRQVHRYPRQNRRPLLLVYSLHIIDFYFIHLFIIFDSLMFQSILQPQGLIVPFQKYQQG